MSHVRSSCRGKTVFLLRTELERLYAQRSAIDAAISELQGLSKSSPIHADAASLDISLELRVKPCNLTNCRSA